MRETTLLTPRSVDKEGDEVLRALTLEQSAPEQTHPLGGTHAGAVHEELKTVGRTHIGEVHVGLCPTGRTPCWSGGAA